eukprot:TRINITY_DN4414_c0_g1_i1.p1 TRINITY_DN4414_c0_g1~~TRINITY_DN4414_c0_g1_i1.p1  ORF type:complete len:115 (-),score=24.92 TRINITY_DN4414_c0_g1_i1:102-446(-)
MGAGASTQTEQFEGQSNHPRLLDGRPPSNKSLVRQVEAEHVTNAVMSAADSEKPSKDKEECSENRNEALSKDELRLRAREALIRGACSGELHKVLVETLKPLGKKTNDSEEIEP